MNSLIVDLETVECPNYQLNYPNNPIYSTFSLDFNIHMNKTA